jgi:serine/threonine-protein kinase
VTPQRWQQVKVILDEALELDPAARRTLVDEACAEDPSLREDLEFYLGLDESRGDFVDRPVFSVQGGKAEIEEASSIGPYKVIRRLGRGGMGAVYLAQREDDYKKLVAVKLIKRGMDTEEIVRRFRNERQVLAQLDHANIARLLDGGSTEDGRPFLAMEYVEGEPIDRYCDERRLAVRERLELFMEVCAAVRFAHQNLVVHRDLKPGNILVTSDGTVKLLDFGIAKVLSGGADFSMLTTVPERRLMTPWYASPEQVRGELITTASDTYTLGVLLYQLLTGRLPYRADAGSESEIGRVICEEEPRRPSAAATGAEPETLTARRADAGKLRKLLAGDLDAVVMKAMEKDPKRRYASVEQLEEDVRRHLEGRPITARTGTFTYRTAKFVRRNRLALGLAGVFFAVLASYGLTTTVLWNRAERARERAQTVSGFLEGLFEASRPDQAQGQDLTAREILDQGRLKLPAYLEEEEDVYATLAGTLGRVYFLIGEYDVALDLAEESLEIQRRRHGEDDLQVAAAKEQLAGVLAKLGRIPRAEQLMREALDTTRHLREGAAVTSATHNLAEILYRSGRYAEAEALFRESFAIKRSLGSLDKRAALTLAGLAASLRAQDKSEEAEQITRQARSIMESQPLEDQSIFADILTGEGSGLFRREDYRGAESVFRQALDIRRLVLGADHDLVASSLVNLAKAIQAQGRLDEAAGLYRQALEIQRSSLGESHRNTAITMKSLASVLAASGDAAQARDLAADAVRIFRVSNEPAWRVADAESVLGISLVRLGRRAEAEDLLVKSYDVLKGDKQDKLTHDALERLAVFYEMTGREVEAEEYRALLKEKGQPGR